MDEANKKVVMNERSVTGIKQWMKLTKDHANLSCDFVNRVLKYTRYMLK